MKKIMKMVVKTYPYNITRIYYNILFIIFIIYYIGSITKSKIYLIIHY